MVQTMTDETSKPELQALRDRMADLELACETPAKVEGFEGIRQLSRAIESQQLDRFALQNSVPDRVFWGWFWAFMMVVAAVLGYGLFMYW